MLLFRRVEPLMSYLMSRRPAAVGFVPTMGALHEGHLSLVHRSQRENDLTVCSIFVNPAQFNDPGDLEKYPRTPSKDIDMLLEVGTAVVFIPPVEEIYPPGRVEKEAPVDLGMLDRILEGEFRPGHFAGVARVMRRLLEIVRPDRLYMGQKDYQQLVVVARLIEQLDLPVVLTGCPTAREADGLAMSSRNQRLTPGFRERVPAIYRILRLVRELMGDMLPEEIEKLAIQELSEAGLRPEYFEIVDGDTLEPVQRFDESDFIVACTAVWAGDVRLIDNLIVKGGGE